MPARGRIALCAHAANCIVVPSIKNNEPREYRVRSPSPPPSPSKPVVSSHCWRLCGAIPRHRGGGIHRLRRCHNHARQAGRHGPPPFQPPVVHLYRCSGRHIHGWHRGWDIHAHGADRLHTQHQSRGPKEGALRRLRHTPVRTRRSGTILFDQFAILWHWKVIRDISMGSAHKCGLG